MASVLGLFAAGWAIPVGAVSLWLAHGGALGRAIQITLGKGTASKGPLWSVLLRPVVFPALDGIFREPFAAALLLIGAVWLFCRRRAAATVLGGVFAVSGVYLVSRNFFPNVEPLATYVGLFSSCFVAAGCSLRRLRGPLDSAGTQIWIFSSVAFAVSYMLSLSWAAYQPMAVPAVAFAVCYGFAHSGRWVRAGIAAATIVVGLAGIALKISLPYEWISWTEPPVWDATGASRFPELAGIHLSPVAIDTTDGAVAAIHSACAPGEPLFAYPYLPLLHLLSHQPPLTYSYLPWFDVTPDDVAEQDAGVLAAHPPCAIAYLALPPEATSINEHVFRGKSNSGQRKLVQTMDSMARSYRILFARQLPGGASLTVYGRGSQ